MSVLQIRRPRRNDVLTLTDGSQWRVRAVAGDDIELVSLKSSVRKPWITKLERVLSQLDQKRRPRA